MLETMSPYQLGQLIALYEHKVFVQGVIWDINSFDQWGVELGKELMTPILRNLSQDQSDDTLDNSTRGLMARYKTLVKGK